MTKRLTKFSIGVGVAGTGFIGPAPLVRQGGKLKTKGWEV